MTLKTIFAMKEPFSFNDLKKRGIDITRGQLNHQVELGKLEMKSFGRMNIYWNKKMNSLKEPSDSLLTKQLELEVLELKKELMAERQKVRKLSIQDGIDEPWKEVAITMARILSEQRQVTLQDILEYFNAPIEE
jgi:hypothetical protein